MTHPVSLIRALSLSFNVWAGPERWSSAVAGIPAVPGKRSSGAVPRSLLRVSRGVGQSQD